jgi:hypothetical protein
MKELPEITLLILYADKDAIFHSALATCNVSFCETPTDELYFQGLMSEVEHLPAGVFCSVCEENARSILLDNGVHL